MKEKRKSKVLSIEDLTSEFYKEEKIQKGINKVEIIETWNKITNHNTQIRTKKIFIKENKLYIQISSSPLRNELTNHKKNILIKIQKEHTSIEDIYFI